MSPGQADRFDASAAVRGADQSLVCRSAYLQFMQQQLQDESSELKVEFAPSTPEGQQEPISVTISSALVEPCCIILMLK